VTSVTSLAHLRKPPRFSCLLLAVASFEAPDQTGRHRTPRAVPGRPDVLGVWHVLSHLTGQPAWHEAPSHPTCSLSKDLAVLHPIPCVLAWLHLLVVLFCMCNKFLYPNHSRTIAQVLFHGWVSCWAWPSCRVLWIWTDLVSDHLRAEP
jgi:hypothetical protein